MLTIVEFLVGVFLTMNKLAIEAETGCESILQVKKAEEVASFGFYGISTNVGYLMPNNFYTNVLNMYDLAWFGLVLWHVNHCRLFNAKSSLYICVKYIGFSFVGVYGISTTVGYLMPTTLYICVKYIWFDFIWFDGLSSISGYLMPNLLYT